MPNDLFIPLQETSDNSDFEGNPKTSFLEGLQTSAVYDLRHGTTPSIIGGLEDYMAPGKQLTTDEYEKSDWKRPAISFPKGVSEAHAKKSAQRYDDQLEYSEKMSGVNNAFLRGADRFVGGTVAFFTDPLNIVAATAATMSGGVISEPFLVAAAEYGAVARIGARAAITAGEATAATFPSEATAYESGKIYGEHPSMLSSLESLGLNAAFGGVLGAAGETISRIITSHSHVDALKVATDQTELGKKVNVDNIMKDGLYQQDRIQKSQEARMSPVEMETKLADERNARIKNLEELKSELSKTEGHEGVKETLDKYLDFVKNNKTDESINFDLPETPESIKPERLNVTQLESGDYDIKKSLGKIGDNATVATRTWNAMKEDIGKVALSTAEKQPVTMADLKATEAKIKSPENENSYDEQEQLQFDREYKDAKEDTQTKELSADDPNLKEPDIDVQNIKDRIESIKDQLPAEAKESYENIGEIEQQHNTIADLISKFADCIRGK